MAGHPLGGFQFDLIQNVGASLNFSIDLLWKKCIYHL